MIFITTDSNDYCVLYVFKSRDLLDFGAAAASLQSDNRNINLHYHRQLQAEMPKSKGATE